MNRVIVVVWSCMLITLAGCERHGTYPNRPIVLICPWAAGGGTDRLSHQVAFGLEQQLGVPVNVVNATGGAGVTGHTRGALARPDGYTLTMATVELNMLPHQRMTNISYRDFQPLLMLNADAAALFVRTEAPWANLAELTEAVRNHPGRLKASGTARGGIWHMALAGWLNSLDLGPDDIRWISIGGSAPSLQELLAGGVDVVSCSLPEAQTLLDNQRVRCLGVMSQQRLETYPDVPTFVEQDVDWSMGGWRGIAMPLGAETQVVRTLVDALATMAESPQFIEFMRTAGFNRRIARPAEFERVMAQHHEQFGKLLSNEAFAETSEGRFGPMVFPMAAVSLLVLSMGAIWHGRDKTPRKILNRRIKLTRGGAEMLGIMACVIGFVLVVESAGYLITAAVMSAGLMMMMRVRWYWSLGAGVILAGVTFVVFATVLRVPLPYGWLG
ncbi:tripartite tricarboxylate transporter substrate binding protein [Planctomycetales bacterium ZRK34]|nr:tripartite tricarboxylate transporter substrate binding protein [Planctomycetales bacterium ZRK34]